MTVSIQRALEDLLTLKYGQLNTDDALLRPSSLYMDNDRMLYRRRANIPSLAYIVFPSYIFLIWQTLEIRVCEAVSCNRSVGSGRRDQPHCYYGSYIKPIFCK
jgi:hypothetical protein